ncbi:MAG: protein phosphatase 2C domain-containing protein [Alphaproteobacteria bacterium]|nr:protein phosphatase 2C domain-containing protein [Alphaproteobacteria bacterium]MDE2110000.1 protein phosphatase 2C domain-containing protein [Alphaproteobacteria bacterium]MDE2495143.1 protein phosphatase 2C domain-containing protein [Alphaproteobacteria bacterium]
MHFELLDSFSIPADPVKANEDAFAAEREAAVVLDGATWVGDEMLLPGPSDAAWIAHFGARRLMAHMRDGGGAKNALRHALADAEKSYAGLRRRPPKETFEIPFASMMLAAPDERGFEALWFGDCAALVRRPGEAVQVVGEAFDKRATEARRVKMLAVAKGIAPAAGSSRAEYLPHLRASRNKVNSGSDWLFSPDVRAADHVSEQHVEATAGALLLLSTDGFLALASDYDAYDADGLLRAVEEKGLKALGEELRALEAGDAEGRRFPRLKKSDDATAVFLRLG